MELALDERAIEQLQNLRSTLKMTESSILNIAIQRLHNEVFVKQEPDDGPLSDDYRAYLQAKANAEIGGNPEFDQSLF